MLSHLDGRQFWWMRVAAVIAGLVVSGCGAIRASGISRSQNVGWIERATLSDTEEVFEAKLDTGATTTSIDAEILDQPEDDTEAGGMIRFRFRGSQGEGQIYERSVVRWVRIKDGDGGFFRRPVVMMQLCVAGQWIEEEVNLADRQQFDYPVLIGRNMLGKGNLLDYRSQSGLIGPIPHHLSNIRFYDCHYLLNAFFKCWYWFQSGHSLCQCCINWWGSKRLAPLPQS